MSDLIARIRQAQTRAAEDLICADLEDKGLAAAPKQEWEYGWLIENGKQQGAGLAYRYIDNDAGGVPAWTEDPNKALRFARRADAEQYAYHDEDAWRIVEHGFALGVDSSRGGER